MVLQLTEFGDPLRLEQVDPGCKNLAEFDKRRPEIFERPPHPLGRRHVHVGFRVAPVQNATGPLECIGQADPAHHVAKAVSHEDRTDIVQTPHVAH